MTRGRPVRVLAPLAVLAVGVLALSACTVRSNPAPSATALPAGVTATLLPATPNQTVDEARLWVENTSDEDLTITKIRITDSRLDGLITKVAGGSVEVLAGQTAEIVVRLPAANCGTDAATSTTAAVEGQVASVGESPSPTPTATPSPAATDDAETATAIIGFSFGAAIGTAVETLSDPEDVIEQRFEQACG